jgi:hypothetical protein
VPLIPAGVAVAIILNRIDASKFFGNQEDAKIGGKLMREYYKQLEKATTDRRAAEEELFESLKTAKAEVVAEYEDIKSQIKEKEEKIETLTEKFTKQLAEYQSTILPFAEKAKKADEKGDIKEKEKWEEKIEKYDPWYEEIALINVDIVQLQLDIFLLQIDLETLQPLTEVEIKKDWAYMISIVGPRQLVKFNVPVPYYPDLPDMPNIPGSAGVPVQQESCVVKEAKKALNKWITCPMVPPMGIAVSGIIGMVQCMTPSLPAPVAAKIESEKGSIMPSIGGIV